MDDIRLEDQIAWKIPIITYNAMRDAMDANTHTSTGLIAEIGVIVATDDATRFAVENGLHDVLESI